jgi:hypothetical protein
MLRRARGTRHRYRIGHCRIRDRPDMGFLVRRFRRSGLNGRRNKADSSRSFRNDIINHLALCRHEGTSNIGVGAGRGAGRGFAHASPFELEWEFEPESTTFTVLRVNSQAPFVELNNLSYERETESSSLPTLATTDLGLYIW